MNQVKLILALLCMFKLTGVIGQAQSEKKISSQSAPAVLRDNNSGKTFQEVSGNKRRLAPKSVTLSEIPKPESESNTREEQAIAGSSASQQAIISEYVSLRNSFLAKDGALSKEERSVLQQMAIQCSSQTANSFAAAYLNLRENRNSSSALAFLSQLLISDPTNKLIPPELAWMAERTGDFSKRQLALNQCVSFGIISPLQMQFGKWAIESMPKGSLLISHGEFDTYSLWINQSNQNVHVISLAMLEDLSWLNKTLRNWDPKIQFNHVPTDEEFIRTITTSSKALYFSPTIRLSLLHKVSSNLFAVGPVFKYASIQPTKLVELSRFYFNQNFQKYVKDGSWKTDPYYVLMRNLLPGLKSLEADKTLKQNELKSVLEMIQLIELGTSKSIRK